MPHALLINQEGKTEGRGHHLICSAISIPSSSEHLTQESNLMAHVTVILIDGSREEYMKHMFEGTQPI